MDIDSIDTVDTIDDVITWSRPDIEVVVIDAKMILPHKSQEHEGDDAFIADGDGEDTATDDGDGNDTFIDDDD